MVHLKEIYGTNWFWCMISVIFSSEIPACRVWRPIAQLVLNRSGSCWSGMIQNWITYAETWQGPLNIRVPIDGDAIYRFLTSEITAFSVWRPIASFFLNLSGCCWSRLRKNLITYTETWQESLNMRVPIDGDAIYRFFDVRNSSMSRLATHSSAGSQPISLRLVMFDRQMTNISGILAKPVIICLVSVLL